MTKLCECGCGGEVHRNRKYVVGHIKKSGSNHPSWRGGTQKLKNGYIGIHLPEHPRANPSGYVREHVLVMETYLKRRILPTEHIHHIDGNRSNNTIGNLILFHSKSGHHLYEGNLKAFNQCGHYDWRKCVYCHNYDDTKNMTKKKNKQSYHKKCHSEYEKLRTKNVCS